MLKDNFNDNELRDNVKEGGEKEQQKISISSLHTLSITQLKFFTKFFYKSIPERNT